MILGNDDAYFMSLYMTTQLEKHGLVLHEIRADGHCLYAAVESDRASGAMFSPLKTREHDGVVFNVKKPHFPMQLFRNKAKRHCIPSVIEKSNFLSVRIVSKFKLQTE